MKHWRCLFFLLLCSVSVGSAQGVTIPDDHFLQDVANYQVKDLEQFMFRFNDQERVIFKNDTAADRYKSLIGLLNLRDTVLCRNPDTKAFLDEVSKETGKVKLALTDSDWYAAAQCAFTYHSKEKIVIVRLKHQTAKNGGSYWTVIGVQSDLFATRADHKATGAFINPMNHEVNFSELSKALTSRKNIYNYTNNDYQPDPLSAFFDYVRNGDLLFKSIKSVDFNFLQVDGWFFTVREFFRVEINSGWLIAAVKRMNPEQKKHFIQHKFIE